MVSKLIGGISGMEDLEAESCQPFTPQLAFVGIEDHLCKVAAYHNGKI